METSFTQFVRPNLFDKSEHITAIQLPHLLVQQTGDGWETTPPQSKSKNTLQKFIDIWQQASTQHIQPADLEQDGEPVEVVLANATSPIQFLIIARDPDLVLARPDYGIQYPWATAAKPC